MVARIIFRILEDFLCVMNTHSSKLCDILEPHCGQAEFDIFPLVRIHHSMSEITPEIHILLLLLVVWSLDRTCTERIYYRRPYAINTQ